MYSRERTALVLPSFQYRLQTAAVPSYKKLNKKGELKVILTDDTLHRKIFYLAKSKSYSLPLHIFTRHKLLDVTPPSSTITPRLLSSINGSPSKATGQFSGSIFFFSLVWVHQMKVKRRRNPIKIKVSLENEKEAFFLFQRNKLKICLPTIIPPSLTRIPCSLLVVPKAC